MLRINIPTNGQSNLTFSGLERYSIPLPPSGFEAEDNDSVIMQFEDEQQAVDYANDIDDYRDGLNDHASPEYFIGCDIIKAISDDEFVRSYIHD